MMTRIVIFFLTCIINITIWAQNKSAEVIYKKTNGAIVRIYTYYDDNTPFSQGSGVILKNEGWIVTNYHVLGDATILYAEHNGKLFKMDSVLAVDKIKDVLVLQLSKQENDKEFKSIPNLKIGNSDRLKVGQKVYAIGSPYGFENTITEGIISGLRTSFSSEQGFIQISAPISSGSSGGAIINGRGELIGISTMVYSGETAQNLNFAILINDVLETARNGKGYTKSLSNKSTDYLNQVDYYYQKGLSDFSSGNYVIAIKGFQSGLPVGNDDSKAILYYYIGLAYHQLGQFDSALANYAKSLDRNNHDVDITIKTYSAVGSAYYKKNDLDQAIIYFKKVAELDSSFSNAYLGLGLVYFTSGDYDKSIENLRKAVQKDPRNAKAYYLLGNIAYQMEKIEASIAFYQQAINIESDFAEAYLGLANAYIKMGDTEKGIQNQQKAYYLNPELRNSKN